MADEEFHVSAVKDWLSRRQIKLSPIPARRHNKAGVVERKNRVVKDIIERLDMDPQHKDEPFEIRLSLAEFISNTMYGNQVASAFEMARGFTPGLQGLKSQSLPESIKIACEELQARRLLQKVLRSRPAHKSLRHDFEIGERVLVLIPGGSRRRGKWVEAVVEQVTDDGNLICGTGRHQRHIAVEDARKIPITILAQNVLRAELGMKRLQEVEGTTENADSFSVPEVTRRIDIVPLDPVTDDSDSSQDDLSLDGGVNEPQRENAIQPLDSSITQNQRGFSLTYHPGLIASDVQQSWKYGMQDSYSNLHEEEDKRETPTRRSLRHKSQTQRNTPQSYAIHKNPLNREHAKQIILNSVFERMGTNQFMKREAPDIPGWIYQESENTELRENWECNKIDVPLNKVPRDSNVIGSHIVCKLKHDDDDSSKLKLK